MSLTRTLTHAVSGASCKIHDFGACLVSYKTGAGRECIFVSRDAKLDGSKAIRGGCPLVFPQFGQSGKYESMPQHGFLRVNFWKADESTMYDNELGAGITYTLDLKDVKQARGGKWDDNTTYDCSCFLHVKINSQSFSTILEIKNTGKNEFEFQTLLHTYYLVDGKAALDGSSCYVKGLEGYSCSDKVSKDEYMTGSDPIVIKGLTDHVYNPPTGKNVVDVTVGVGGGREISVKATGTVGEKSVQVSCVVWNPNKENAAGMSDFGDDQYHDMICVEPGILGNEILKAGESASLTQLTEML